MARRDVFVTISAEGRDQGKVFKITEMPALQAEKWATRTFLALARGGVEIPDDIAQSGLPGIATLGMKIFGNMRWEDAEPLLDEMMGCVQAVPDPKRPDLVTKLFDDASIEEIGTYLTLRKAVFGLHVDFSELAAAYRSALAASKSAASPTT